MRGTIKAMVASGFSEAINGPNDVSFGKKEGPKRGTWLRDLELANRESREKTTAREKRIFEPSEKKRANIFTFHVLGVMQYLGD